MTEPDAAKAADLILVEDRLWVASAPTGVPGYDFAFGNFFHCKRPWDRPAVVHAVGRIGAPLPYSELYPTFAAKGIQLLHTPEEHDCCALLSGWYPHLRDLTPRSVMLTAGQGVEAVESLGWPLFMKGDRQTARHQPGLSIIENPEQFRRVLSEYARDPILRWQPIVCREFVPLRSVDEPDGQGIPPSFEFRTFCWNGCLVGDWPYWPAADYGWSGSDRRAGLELAEEAARRINVAFPVIDVAQTADGRWIVIECNDGQESGYTGASALGIWANVIALLKDVSV